MSSSSDNDDSMAARLWRGSQSQHEHGAYGKQPLRDDVAERIKNQSHENQLRRLRDQIQELNNKLGEEQQLRRNERTDHELEVATSLVLIDKLLDFIAQNFGGDLPRGLYEMIAERQEQRLLTNPPSVVFDDSISTPSTFIRHPLTNVAPPLGKDGQVLRKGADGSVGYVNPFTGEETPVHGASESLRKLLKYLE